MLSAQVKILPKARRQIRDVLHYTRLRFGDDKARDYALLVRFALRSLVENPKAGKLRAEIHDEAWTLHISRPGHNARHVFLYRIRERVEIARFLYDGMDLPRHWPRTWG